MNFHIVQSHAAVQRER